MVRRRILLALSIVIVAAVAVLASSLHDVRFAPGRVFSAQVAAPAQPAVTTGQSVSDIPLWKMMLLWLLFAANLVLFFFLLPPATRKRVLGQMISMALTVLALMIAIRYRLVQLPVANQEPPSQLSPGKGLPQGGASMPAFQPPPLTPWWTFAISFIVLALVLTLLWLAYRWWLRRASRYGGLGTIGAIARSSLGELAAGREWTNVIIQSYIQMGQAVGKARSLQRASPVTPREFAARLEAAGLPAQAVQRLTRLFEAARYGTTSSSQAEVNEAVACLNAILQACGLAL